AIGGCRGRGGRPPFDKLRAPSLSRDCPPALKVGGQRRPPPRLQSWMVLALVAIAAGGARAAEPAIIAKARAFVGAESALNAMKSVHYTGTLVTTQSDDPSKTLRQTVEIIVQKPDQQRVTVTSEKTVEI